MDDKIRKEISRRNLFRYLGNSVVMLPFMRTLMETQAFGETTNKRAVFFYYPDGIIESAFHPTSIGTGFVLPGMTAPLGSVQGDIIMIKGVDYKTSNSHQGGANYALTGCENSITNVSIDTYLGSKFPKTIPALRLGVATQYEGADIAKALSFSAVTGGQPTLSQIEDNPTKAFNALFGGSTSSPSPTSGAATGPVKGLSNTLKKSLLDDNLEQIKGLQSKLGTLEKTKLDLHLASIREIERRLQSSTTSTTTASAQCTKTISQTKTFAVNDTNYPKAYWTSDVFDAVVDMQTQIAIQAMACGVTNVVLLQMSHSVSNAHFANGMPSSTGTDHHDTSHYKNGSLAMIHTQNQAYMMTKYANLIKGMSAIKEGDKSLLYNSVALAFSELGDSDDHKFKNMGLVLAGQAGGYFRTGRCIDGTGMVHNNLLVSILQSMGLSDTTFGRTDVAAGGIDALKG